jgi:hypothetical protein
LAAFAGATKVKLCLNRQASSHPVHAVIIAPTVVSERLTNAIDLIVVARLREG